VKDIMDEIHIITRIKEQQQIVMQSFVKQIRRALLPGIKTGKSNGASSSWDLVLGTAALNGEDRGDAEKNREHRERAKLTLSRADHLLRDIEDRIFELNTLLENAKNTSAAVSGIPVSPVN
jgi:hypothetical protein